MINIDPQKVTDALQFVAAELILPRFRNLAAGEISSKSSPTDLVTIADREAEAALIPILTGLWPGSTVIGEEGVAENPALLQQLGPDGVFWIVDPVDGTWNFTQGNEQFGTMVALVVEGETVMSWIYPPLTGHCATAEKGSGAFWQGQRLATRKDVSFEHAVADYSPKYMTDHWRDRLTPSIAKTASKRRGRCSAYAYLDMLTGKIDLTLSGMIFPWDHAPGTLMVAEAGGHTAFLEDGEIYRPIPHGKKPMLTVADKALWAVYAQALLGEV